MTLIQAEEDSAVAGNLNLTYALGYWIMCERELSIDCTSSLKTLACSTGSGNFTFIVAQIPPQPALPTGITGVKPCALQRTFDLAVIIKCQFGYTETLDLDRGTVGAKAPPLPPPSDGPERPHRRRADSQLGGDGSGKGIGGERGTASELQQH